MIFKSILVYPKYPENLKKLYQLAYNLWCTWNYDAVNLFYRIDADLFRKVQHNPVHFLYRLSPMQIEVLSKDKSFLFELDGVWDKFQEYLKYGFTIAGGDGAEISLGPDDMIAYFSMEYGLHECIPIYAGGLGVLAGDFLKGASDLGIPFVGVGLIYKYGYLTQRIGLDNKQEEIFIEFENHLIPLQEIHTQKKEKLYITLRLGYRDIKIKLWQIEVGKTRLILLDTDIDENPEDIRSITYELYVGNREKRLQQELILGLGGIKALQLLGIEPKVYHLNEGHSAFLIMGRLQTLMEDQKKSFSEAKVLIRASTVFTTHTPVIAGNENFNMDIVERYVAPILKPLAIPFDKIARLGIVAGDKKTFWLPAFAMQFSRYINAVSKQHAEVSRKMWSGIFPQKAVAEIPISNITNGIHRYWISEHFTYILSRYLGPEYIHIVQNPKIWARIFDVPYEEIWEAHRRNKQDMVNFIRGKLANEMASRGHLTSRIFRSSRTLNPEYMTIVFARRFATYKRPMLILHDKERLKKILLDTRKPAQLIFAGKAHPDDAESKEMIKEIIEFSKDPAIEGRVIFLENYDMNIARHLVWGADVWLNNPIADMEASGTSGMKAGMNGVLQLSTLEGWWKEGFNGRNGWVINAGGFYQQEDIKEVAEANQIYELLEDEITELYYERNDAGIPEMWVRMMKEAIYSICQNYNMNAVIWTYLRQAYLPARKNLEKLTENNGKLLKEFAAEENLVLKYWDAIKPLTFQTNIEQEDRVFEGETAKINCTVYIDQAPTEAFTVELFYMFHENTEYRIIPMELVQKKDQIAYYSCLCPIEGYGLQSINVRIRPANELVADSHPELVKWAGG